MCFDVYGANSLYNWELFFHAPLYIATSLSKNGKYKEAMQWFHYIFDPTTDAMQGTGESEISRYWKVLPFKTTPAESLENWFRELSPNTAPSNPMNDMINESPYAVTSLILIRVFTWIHLFLFDCPHEALQNGQVLWYLRSREIL